jgi:hypothetical protein
MNTIQMVLSHPLFMPLLVTVVIILVFPLVAGYIVLVERKVLADFQVRLGPMRVGPHGLLQPLADALKLLLKEDIIPSEADKAIFWFAPMISTVTGLAAFAVLPFGKYIFVADVNVGLLVGARRAAQRGATGELRSGARVRAAVRCDDRGHAEYAGHRGRAAEGRDLVRVRELRLHGGAVRGVHGGRGR